AKGRAERALPPECPNGEGHENDRHDDEGSARRGYIGDVGDEHRCDKNEHERESRPRAPQLGSLPEQSEGANREDHALHDVVLDWHTEAFVAAPLPGDTWWNHERPGTTGHNDRD